MHRTSLLSLRWEEREGGRDEGDTGERPGPRDLKVTLLDGEGYRLDPEHPFHLTPFMTHAVARSEARTY